MMDLSALIQEKVLAGVDLQIRNAKSDPALEWQDRDSLLASLCLGFGVTASTRYAVLLEPSRYRSCLIIERLPNHVSEVRIPCSES